MEIVEVLISLIPLILVVALVVHAARGVTEGSGFKAVRETVPAVIVLLVAVLVVGSMADVAEDRDFELYDCVPVSTFGNDVSIEGDCAEIVTIGGTEYVRMTDLGTFTVTADGNEKEYSVDPAKLDLVLMTGQSQTVHNTNPSYYDGSSPVAPGKAFYLGFEDPASDTNAGLATRSNVGEAGIVDLVDSDGKVRVAGMYPVFCSDYVSETGHRLLVVNTGIGGKTVDNWDDGGVCDDYMHVAFDRVEQLASAGSVKLKTTVALWSQGESDAGNTVDFYKEHFVPLLEKLWDGDYGYAFGKVLSTVPMNRHYESPINPAIAQMDIAEEYDNFVIASTLALHLDPAIHTHDTVHYTQTVYGWMGEAFARSAAQVMGYRPVSQSLVLAAENGVYDVPPSKVDVYGTSGNAYKVSASWTSDLSTGTWTATLSNPPPGTTLVANTAEALTTLLYDSTDGTMVVRKNVSGSSNAWDSYAANVKYLTLSEEVSSVSGTAFTGCTALEYLSIPSTLTTAAASLFGVSFADATGQAITDLEPGFYAGSGDGILYLMDEDLFAYTTSGASITGLSESGASALYLVVPSEHTGATVIQMSGAAFLNNTVMKKVIFLPDSGLTTLGTGAFKGCTALEQIDLPSTVTTIGANAFQGCTALTSFAVPSGTTAIPQGMLRECTALTSVSIPSGVTTIDQYAFYLDTAITGFEIPALTSVGNRAFSGCQGVTQVSFAAGFAPDLSTVDWSPNWIFYESDGTTLIDKTVASNLAGHSYAGTYAALVEQS